MTIAIDKLALARRLRDTAGFTPAHAEAAAEAFADSSAGVTDLATKADIAALDAKIELVRRDRTIRMAAMIMALGGYLTAIKYFG